MALSRSWACIRNHYHGMTKCECCFKRQQENESPRDKKMLKEQQPLIDGATSVFTDCWGQNRWWRHLSIVHIAHKTVVQRVRSNRWRFNFEMARTGGQINFSWKTAMIITTTKTSILIICPFLRGLLLTYPISPPPLFWWWRQNNWNWNFVEKGVLLT